MKKHSHATKIVLCEHLGFLSIMVLCFLDELLKLPSLIFSDNPLPFLYQRSTIELLLVLAVWLLVVGTTRRLLKRVKYLEDFMRICAWCRRIRYKDEWIPFEDFLEQRFEATTTHGICRDCLDKQRAAAKQSKAPPKTRRAKSAPAELPGQGWLPFPTGTIHKSTSPPAA